MALPCILRAMSDLPVILVADDTENDILLLRHAFGRAHILNPVRMVLDGDEAVAYLAGEAKFSDRSTYPLPVLLLLDVKMPKRDGFEVLEWIRTQRQLAGLNVVMFSSSNQARDVSRAHEFGAKSYLVKPVSFNDLVEMSRMLKIVWHLDET